MLTSNMSHLAYSDPTQLLHRRFEDIAENYKNKIALLVFDSKGEVVQQISYQALNKKINQLAYYLQQKYNVKKGDLIALPIREDATLFIIQVFAIWKCAAAYLPVDMNQDMAQRHSILQDAINNAQPTFILSNERLPVNCRIIPLPNEETLTTFPTTNPQSTEAATPDDLAYIICTSGSTGRPKAVEICHRGLPYCIKSLQKTLEVTHESCVAQMASVAFDASLSEIGIALCQGATLSLIPPFASQKIIKKIFNYHPIPVTQAIFVPSRLLGFKPNDFNAIKTITVVGSTFEKELILPWFHHINTRGERVKIVNGYGPTETTIATSLGVFNGDKIHAGQPIEGLELHIIENQIVVSGIGLARGYRNNEEANAKFITISHPKTMQPIRAYLTGDYGCLDEEGNLIIEGRIDRQFKLREKRLSLDFIENCIKGFTDKVKNAAVIGVKLEADSYLVAFIEWKEKLQESSVELKNALWNYLEKTQGLKVAEIPRILIETEIPLSSVSGKINYNKLKSIPIKFPYTDSTAYPDSLLTFTEEILASIWKKALGHVLNEDYKIHPFDNFLCLGGSSLSAMEIGQAIQENTSFPFSSKYRLTDIYQLSHLRSMARRISLEPLTLLQKGKKSHLPLFFIHSLFGDSRSEYHPILSQLQNPCYGFTAYGLLQEDNLDADLEQLAADYVNTLILEEKIQLNKPIVLIGWSSGGIAAYCMAQQLQNKGFSPRVILIDSAFPYYDKKQIKKLFDFVLTTKLKDKDLLKSCLKCVDEYLEETTSIDISIINKKLKDILNNQLNAELKFIFWLLEKEVNYTAKLTSSPQNKVKGLLLYSADNPQCVDWQLHVEGKTFFIPNTNHFTILESPQAIKPIQCFINEALYVTFQNKFIEKIKAKLQVDIPVNKLDGEISFINEDNYLPVTLMHASAQKPLPNYLLAFYDFTPSVSKTSICFADLIKEKRIVIQGQSGSGRTLLSHYLAQQWAKGRLWKNEIDCAIHLSFNEVAVDWKKFDKYALAKLIIEKYKGKGVHAISKKKIKAITHLLANHNVLWILDGFDQINFQNEHPIVKKILAQPRVIITSRPEAIHDLDYDLLLDNIGFSSSIIKQHAYPNAFSYSDLPLSIKKLIKLPLIFNLFNQYLSHSREFSDINRAKLYDYMVERLINLASEKLSSGSDKNIKKEYFKKMLLSCIKLIAFNASKIYQHELIDASIIHEACEKVTLDGAKNIQGMIQCYPQFDFLTELNVEKSEAVKHVLKLGMLSFIPNNTRYAFIHFSIQEYLTASYFVDQVLKEKDNIKNVVLLTSDTKKFVIEILLNNINHAKDDSLKNAYQKLLKELANLFLKSKKPYKLFHNIILLKTSQPLLQDLLIEKLVTILKEQHCVLTMADEHIVQHAPSMLINWGVSKALVRNLLMDIIVKPRPLGMRVFLSAIEALLDIGFDNEFPEEIEIYLKTTLKKREEVLKGLYPQDPLGRELYFTVEKIKLILNKVSEYKNSYYPTLNIFKPPTTSTPAKNSIRFQK